MAQIDEEKKNEAQTQGGQFNMDEDGNTMPKPAPKDGYKGAPIPPPQGYDVYSQANEMFKQADNYEAEAQKYDAAASAPSKVDTSNRGSFVRQFIAEHPVKGITEDDMKRERNKRRIAALGDGLTALANFAGAVAGATPMQQTKTLTEAQKQRFDEAMKVQNGLNEAQRKELMLQYKELDDLEDERIKLELKAEAEERKGNQQQAREFRKQAGTTRLRAQTILANVAAAKEKAQTNYNYRVAVLDKQDKYKRGQIAASGAEQRKTAAVKGEEARKTKQTPSARSSSGKKASDGRRKGSATPKTTAAL